MTSIFSVENPVVVVTGGAHGIGRATVESFAAADARVYAVDINEALLKETFAADDRVTPVVADISTAYGADTVVAATGGHVDILCNNAAVIEAVPLAAPEDIPDDDWLRVLAINLTGPFLLTKRVLPDMVSSGGGSIVNVASISAAHGGRAAAAYTASKHGLVGLTKNVAVMHGPNNIRCNAVCPGNTATGIIDVTSLTDNAHRMRSRDQGAPPPGTPQEIANAIVFLASAAASRINGAVLTVDAGLTAF